MLKRGQVGFTLIEITLVFAISGLLAAIALGGQTQLRERARFTDSVEFTKNALAKVKNEATTTVEQGGGNNSAAGVCSGCMFFAKRVTFHSGTSDMDVDTLLYNPVSNQIVPGIFDHYTVNLPWNLKYQSAIPTYGNSTSDQAYFVRWPSTGRFYTYTNTLPRFNDQLIASFDPFTPGSNRASRIYQFSATASTTHTATLTINGLTDSISAVYNP